MAEDFSEDFLENYDDNRFPQDFLQQYEPMECFSHNEMGETLLVKERQTGTYYAAKCYTEKSLISHISESELLRRLHHHGLPAYISEHHNENMLCVVRTYIQGRPLNELAREKRFTKQQAIDIVVQLCDILFYLHGQSPPIIHRDIKPQNIIMDDNEKITLIDFGISRTYNETAQEDTLCFGTRYFAAPEQYGFSQTDCRSDIFSVGILLCWLLTGSMDVKQAFGEITDRKLMKAVRKCTAFDPKDRYSTISQLKDELIGRRIRRRLLLSLCAILCLVIAAVHFLDPFSFFKRNPADAVFQESLIEEAVRLELGKKEGEAISEQELLAVKNLYIWGDKVAADADAFNELMNDFVNNEGNITRGSITTLNDLQELKNLQSISLVYQNITDLSPLSNLVFLEYIDLHHNPIEDVSPLSQIPSLRSLTLFDTNVRDLSALRSCTKLTSLDVGDTQITSLTALNGLASLRNLMLRKAPLQSLDHIDTFTMLERLYLSETMVHDLTPLLALPNLQLVEVDQNMQEAANAVINQALFEIIFQEK
ncbi:MAG: protein kinase [Anaerolineaceae bacterium]